MDRSAPPAGAAGGKRAWTLLAALSLALAVAAVAAWWPVGDNGFLSYDDNAYLTDNHRIRQGFGPAGIAWAFTSVRASNWHPLTWMSHLLDYSLFGLAPAGHHLMSLALHVATGVALLLLLARLTGRIWPAALAAALWTLHPVNAESVAWAAERKSVLSTLLWVLATGAYLRYLRRPTRAAYALVVVAFAAGLLAKPMLVTLPLTLLLLDFWPLGRLGTPAPGRRGWAAARAPLLEKAPLLALSAASAVVTLLVQRRGGAVNTLAAYPLALRVENAVVSTVVYLRKLAWPSDLAVFYPFPDAGIPAARVAAAALLLAALGALAWRVRRSRPFVAVGLLWFLVTLAPVIGVVKVGSQAMADRYASVPALGLFAALAWGLCRAPLPPAGRAALAAGCVAALAALGALSWRQAGVWKDDASLMAHAIATTGPNWQAHEILGVAHAKAGRLEDSRRELRESLRINPANAGAHYNLGLTLVKGRAFADAEREFRAAVALRPAYPAAWSNLGAALDNLGRADEAMAAYRTAIALDPEDVEAHNNLGIDLAVRGRTAEALAHFETAARLAPDAPGVLDNLRRARALAAPGR
jgi:Flp pilus assembly protein TadD